jgi:hypothetical protein
VGKNFKKDMVSVYFMRQFQQVGLNETLKSFSMRLAIWNFGCDFNKLLNCSRAVHTLAKFHYAVLNRFYDLHQLFIRAHFDLLLGEIVAKGITHQRVEVRDCFFENYV